MFGKVLIANRGEIAVRIARTCRELEVKTVAVFSDADTQARHVSAADEAVNLPGVAATQTYLNLEAVLEAAGRTGADAIHPGYGFFSERADAAQAVIDAGFAWVGPPPSALEAVGDKVRARRLAGSIGVSVVPGTLESIRDEGEVHAFGEANGYPIAIKAAGGGGGRGFRVADGPRDVRHALEAARNEAQAYFGSGDVYLERYLRRPKHIEIQILAPAAGQAMWLGARDCSLQRRHQKLIEETPPARHRDVIPRIGDAAVRVMNACAYLNAGTVEFLVDEDGVFHFLEVNARLQVEHTITEEVTGLDLVACQLQIASGERLGFDPPDLEPGGRLAPKGHAIECRINAEDPARAFSPSPGRLDRYVEPGGAGIRVDSGFGEGDAIPDAYDSLIGKLVAWGADREEARERMLNALADFRIEGVRTTIPAHRLLLEHASFVDGSYSTRTVEEGALAGLERDGTADAVFVVAGDRVRLWHPAIAGSVSAASRAAGAADGVVLAPMHGTILKVLVGEGDTVAAGDGIAVLEAMKMETYLTTGAGGTVRELRVRTGTVVEAGEVVALVS